MQFNCINPSSSCWARKSTNSRFYQLVGVTELDLVTSEHRSNDINTLNCVKDTDVKTIFCVFIFVDIIIKFIAKASFISLHSETDAFINQIKMKGSTESGDNCHFISGGWVWPRYLIKSIQTFWPTLLSLFSPASAWFSPTSTMLKRMNNWEKVNAISHDSHCLG